MNRKFDPLNFSTENYFRLLGLLTSGGYNVVDFSTVKSNQKHLVLRHDVDFDLEIAAQLAGLETERGYQSTFFVLLSSEFYNPVSQNGRAALRSIIASGHEIGLHFDTSIYHDDADGLSAVAENECQILEQLIGQRITVISMHRPLQSKVGKDLNFAGRLNTYAPQFTRGMGYCSDSRGIWRFGNPIDHGAVAQGMALQLLTHPIWWIGRDGASAQERIVQFLEHRREALSQEAAAQCQAYKPNDGGS